MEEVVSIDKKGQGIIRSEMGSVSVRGALPGDVVSGSINWNRGRVKNEQIQRGAYAIPPFCSHAEVCGGCQWQHVPYELQLKHKETILHAAYKDLLSEKEYNAVVLPIVQSTKQSYYRNKMEFTFSNRRWFTEPLSPDAAQNTPGEEARGLGLHVRKHFDRVVDIDTCYLQESNTIRNSIRDFALMHDMSFYDVRKHTGLLRLLLLRTSRAGEIMVVPIFAESDYEMRTLLLNHIQEKHPEVSSLQYIINEGLNDNYAGCKTEMWSGTPYITERCGDLQFRIYPLSFFQTNPYQAEVLYKLVHQWASEEPVNILYDIYCGIGSIGLFLADISTQVIGLEEVSTAVLAARENAVLNDIAHAEFVEGKAEDVLSKQFYEQHGRPDLVVVDPPRMGLHPRALETLLKSGSKRIIYVSCNPVTQAHDIEKLSSAYRLCRLQPVDMFPQTHHLESVALLEAHNSSLPS